MVLLLPSIFPRGNPCYNAHHEQPQSNQEHKPHYVTRWVRENGNSHSFGHPRPLDRLANLGLAALRRENLICQFLRVEFDPKAR